MAEEERKQLVSDIIEIEWEMFSTTKNANGKAACQEDRQTFEINRYGQASNWSEAMLTSYRDDLILARSQGRNLMAEKYARMMASTWPEEYEQIKDSLPPLHPSVPDYIEKIAAIVLPWEQELHDNYPNIAKRSRPLYSRDDTRYLPSFETYLRGELTTYSPRTLKLYYEHAAGQQKEGVNGSAVTLDYMMKQYGFNSAQEADNKLASA